MGTAPSGVGLGTSVCPVEATRGHDRGGRRPDAQKRPVQATFLRPESMSLGVFSSSRLFCNVVNPSNTVIKRFEAI